MKKVLLNLLLASVSIFALQAVETDEHNNRLYFTVGECDDLTQVPVLLHLENPTVAITAVEMYISFPEGVTVISSETDTRSAGTHEVIAGTTSSGYFVSVASEDVERFAGNEGAVCTLLCDFSTLADGDYTVTSSGVFAIGVEGDVVTSYTTQDQNEVFTKKDGILTGIDAVKADEGKLVIYNLQGVRMKEPQKGQINIINGKKLIL